ncbi:hypothetical protein [Bradyrhizobium guangxiense]|uniref:hypothetical protein n=1 Tax=Bradyrhizobium guangxiense TaxID=1325115 RepID=UPI0013E8A3F2|nr:hypothetical protein [Bradyrhizobium guangxiense]
MPNLAEATSAPPSIAIVNTAAVHPKFFTENPPARDRARHQADLDGFVPNAGVPRSLAASNEFDSARDRCVADLGADSFVHPKSLRVTGKMCTLAVRAEETMRRRDFIRAFAVAAGLPAIARAQQGQPVVGFLSTRSPVCWDYL